MGLRSPEWGTDIIGLGEGRTDSSKLIYLESQLYAWLSTFTFYVQDEDAMFNSTDQKNDALAAGT